MFREHGIFWESLKVCDVGKWYILRSSWKISCLHGWMCLYSCVRASSAMMWRVVRTSGIVNLQTIWSECHSWYNGNFFRNEGIARVDTCISDMLRMSTLQVQCRKFITSFNAVRTVHVEVTDLEGWSCVLVVWYKLSSLSQCGCRYMKIWRLSTCFDMSVSTPTRLLMSYW